MGWWVAGRNRNSKKLQRPRDRTSTLKGSSSFGNWCNETLQLDNHKHPAMHEVCTFDAREDEDTLHLVVWSLAMDHKVIPLVSLHALYCDYLPVSRRISFLFTLDCPIVLLPMTITRTSSGSSGDHATKAGQHQAQIQKSGPSSGYLHLQDDKTEKAARKATRWT